MWPIPAVSPRRPPPPFRGGVPFLPEIPPVRDATPSRVLKVLCPEPAAVTKTLGRVDQELGATKRRTRPRRGRRGRRNRRNPRPTYRDKHPKGNRPPPFQYQRIDS